MNRSATDISSIANEIHLADRAPVTRPIAATFSLPVLISTISAEQRNIPIWKEHIVRDGGPCGWAARCDDVASELKRLAAAGLAVQGPFAGSRQRPDGQTAAWNLGFVGDQPPGAVLPFIIEDTAPGQNACNLRPALPAVN